MKAFRLLAPPAEAVDALAAAEAELVRVRTELEHAETESKRLGHAWLTAATQQAAEEIGRARVELERVAKRSQLQIPELEAQVTAAKADKQRHGLARHKAAIAAFVPELIAAVEAAVAVQVQAINLRQAAVAELGENIVAGNIPHIAFAGILMPDICAAWSRDLQRMFNPPPPAPATAPAARPKVAAAKPVVTPSAPRPPRAPRRDPPPEDPGQVTIRMLRPGIDLGDGSQSVTGDELTMMHDQARLLVLRGCADYLPKKDNANG
jgi:hypothetical protein